MEIHFELCFPELKDFIIYNQVVKNRRERTVYDYYRDLLIFWRYMKYLKKKVAPNQKIDDIDVTDIDIDFIKTVTIEDIYRYFEYLRIKRNNKERTIARRSTSLKAFFRYLYVTKGVIDNNPAVKLEMPVIKKEPPIFMDEAECIVLLDSIHGEDKERDYCVLVVFINCGITLSEMVRINDTDIKPNGEVTIHESKGGTRTIYFNQACMEALDEYQKYKEKFFEGKRYDHHAIFISQKGKRLTGRWIEIIVKRRMEAAGFGDKGINPRKLRHTAAKVMYRRGVDIKMLKEILGHEGLCATENYVEPETFDIESFMKGHQTSRPKKNAVDKLIDNLSKPKEN